MKADEKKKSGELQDKNSGQSEKAIDLQMYLRKLNNLHIAYLVNKLVGNYIFVKLFFYFKRRYQLLILRSLSGLKLRWNIRNHYKK